MARLILPRLNPRKLALVLLVLALVAFVAGCGGSAHTATKSRLVGGDGFVFRAPVDWKVRRSARTVQSKSGDALVSVTIFALPRPFRPPLWSKAVEELDRVARQLAKREQAKLTSSETTRIAGRPARVYELDHAGVQERLGFVLLGRREYELFCRGAGADCDMLFSSFDFRSSSGSTPSAGLSS